MHILQASFVMNFANAAVIGFCVLGIGFMLCFLAALTKERKTSLAGFRLEYRANTAALDAATRRARASFPVQPSSQPNGRKEEYDRGEVSSGAPQALKEVALTREYRFTGSSWQEPNRV